MVDETKGVTPAGRPARPDEETFKLELGKRKRTEEQTLAALKEAQAKLNEIRPENRRSGANDRLQAINAELSELKDKQAESKASRGSTQDKIKKLDDQVKAKIAEIKVVREKVPFKSVEDIDKELARLTQQMNIGKLTLVEEKKTSKSVEQLKTQRKQFSTIADMDKYIQDRKQEIAQLKVNLTSPEQKADQAQFEKLKQEKDEHYASEKSNFAKVSEMRDKVKAARQAHDAAYADLKSFQDDHYNAKRQYFEYDRAMKKARDEKRVAEREAFYQGKRKALLEEKLAEAKFSAYESEIQACYRLLRINGVEPSKNAGDSEGKKSLAADAQRTVQNFDKSGLRETKKKSDEDAYFIGASPKKSKKKSKQRSARLNNSYAPGALEDYALVKVEQPSTEEDIPAVIERIEGQLKWYKDNSEKATQENVSKAQKELDDFDKESKNSATTSKETNKNNATNGIDTTESGLATETKTSSNADANEPIAEG